LKRCLLVCLSCQELDHLIWLRRQWNWFEWTMDRRWKAFRLRWIDADSGDTVNVPCRVRQTSQVGCHSRSNFTLLEVSEKLRLPTLGKSRTWTCLSWSATFSLKERSSIVISWPFICENAKIRRLVSNAFRWLSFHSMFRLIIFGCWRNYIGIYETSNKNFLSIIVFISITSLCWIENLQTLWRSVSSNCHQLLNQWNQ
jgi:hypothetical protein